MPYYLQHPEHGTHICYSLEDVKAHKAIGWTDKSEAAKQDDIKPPQERKKPGPKPKVKQ